MTSHSTFRLPLDLNDIEISKLKLKIYREKLREAEVITWDQASMIPKKRFENSRYNIASHKLCS